MKAAEMGLQDRTTSPISTSEIGLVSPFWNCTVSDPAKQEEEEEEEEEEMGEEEGVVVVMLVQTKTTPLQLGSEQEVAIPSSEAVNGS